jgi:hypothetical protein
MGEPTSSPSFFRLSPGRAIERIARAIALLGRALNQALLLLSSLAHLLL